MYRARRPFDPLKLYRLIEGKFILLQEEADDDKDGEEDEDEEESEPEAYDRRSDDSLSSHPGSSASTSDKVSEPEVEPMSDATVLANKKADPYFKGLHRSKGIFWLATRPYQMGSWSTAGAMMTLGSEMPWFCCVDEEQWGADEDTTKAIKRDFEGRWGDRRQELVFIGEGVDEAGLTKLLDSCLLTRTEMRKWEGVMTNGKLNNEGREEKLAELWDEDYWAEWPRGEDGEELVHDHDHKHGHAHRH